MEERLQELISTMDIPTMRQKDIPWLLRNLGIRNENHPDYEEANALVRKIIKGQTN